MTLPSWPRMPLTMHSMSTLGGDPATDVLFSPAAEQALLGQARALQAGAQHGALPPLLGGKRLGLMSRASGDEAARLFCRAAAELGAHVSLIEPRLDEDSDAQQVDELGRLLSRLYDAVECQGLSPALVRRLGRAATIPVYEALAGDAHPSARLAAQLPGEAAVADKRRWLLQAALLESVG